MITSVYGIPNMIKCTSFDGNYNTLAGDTITNYLLNLYVLYSSNINYEQTLL